MRKEQYRDLAEMCNGVTAEVERWVTEYVKSDILEPDEWFELPARLRNDIAGLVASVVGEALVRHGPKQRAHHDNLIQAMNELAGS